MDFRTNCPNCGAPIDYSKASCAYCDTPYFPQTNCDSKSATESLADKLIGDGDKSLDTLLEIVAWIKHH